jgi:hypothetical protein
MKAPKVLEVLHEFRSEEEWNECTAYDVVVATPKTTSPIEGEVVSAPSGLFDLLMIDEAHHAPASTWAALIDAFASADTKTILMSGTPYRRDQIEINADLIFDYPIGRSVHDGIFAPVKFVAIRRRTRSKDLSLAKKCLETREEIIKDYGERPLLLIKTDRIKHANELVDIYHNIGLDVYAIHSHQNEEENKEILQKLRANEIDGVVAVGMVGEGLDVAKLKLAVFHRNPQSLPHTIQVIGRLARTGTTIRQGTVIGDPDDFSRETFLLYYASPDWFRLIPQLERKLIAGRVGKKSTRHLSGEEDFLFESDIRPFYTVTAYKCESEAQAVETSAVENWSYHSSNLRLSVERVSKFKGDTTIVITKKRSQPNWIKSGGYSRILHDTYGLHIFFQHKQWLLQYSTDENVASRIRERLIKGSLLYVNPEALNRVMDSGDGSYVVVGLKSSAGTSLGIPSYKMMLGREAQASITHSDTKAFHAGHCLMRLDRNDRASEVRGIAYKKSRIWALRRDNLRLFREWCLLLAMCLDEDIPAHLPGLERLRVREQLDSFSMRPLAVVQNPSLLTRRVKFVLYGDRHLEVENAHNDLVVTGYSDGKISFEFPDLEISCISEIDGKGSIVYSVTPDIYCSVTVDPIDGSTRSYPIIEFLEEFPPTFLFPDGSNFVDGFYSRPATIPELDSSIVTPIDWIGCDIHSEVDDTSIGVSVQRFIDESYLPMSDAQVMVIKDHAAREIADTIAIDLERNHITLFHVKSVGKDRDGNPAKPGGRKGDIEDLVSQAICSCRWIKHEGFARELDRRLSDRTSTRVLRGNASKLRDFISNYSPVLFSFEVIIAQPAISADKISRSLKSIIASAQDFVATSGSGFSILCSQAR